MHTRHRAFTSMMLFHCLAAALLVPLVVRGQTVPGDRFAELTAYYQEEIDAGRLAGIVSLVYADDDIQHFQAQGSRDLETGLPMTTDTIFRIFSMTKPIVGTALMILYDEGKFALDDPVANYLPELADIQVLEAVNADGSFNTVPADHAMTIRELMSHTGGLVYTLPLSTGPIAEAYTAAGVLDRDSTLKDMMAKIAQLPLNHQPGSRWEYSISVDVQGYLVEVLSGRPLDAFLRERLFAPLGMSDTDFYVRAENAARLATRNTPGEGGKLTSTRNGPYLAKPAFLSGGGGLASTAADYLRFARMHLNKGELDGTRILSAEAAGLMRSNQIPPAVPGIGPFYPGNNAFGLDFAVVTDAQADGAEAGSFWWWGIDGTWFWIDPDNGLIFIGMIQHGDILYSRRVHRRTKDILYNR